MKTAFKQSNGSVEWRNYQNLPGYSGERKLEDRQKFIENDFKGASVLDLGCWGGQMMLEAKRLGATKVLGVEIDRKAIEIGRGLGLEIIRDDLESPFLWKELPKFDVILCLAILGNMKNKEAVLSNASQSTDIMYVEGHGSQHKFTRADWVNLFLTYTTFNTIEYLGEIVTRPFFRLAREDKTLDYIKSKGYKRIAIIGKPGAGKTYLTQFFKDYTIYSDRKDVAIQGEKIVVDNHGALTLTDFDCVINVIAGGRLKRVLNRTKTMESKKVIEFCDTVSPLYIKGAYDFYTITN